MVFESWNSFGKASWSIRRESRYVFTPATDSFLKAVIATSTSRKRRIKGGQVLWRAQLGNGWQTICQDNDQIEIKVPYPAERMKPLRHEAREGRANPKGIPYLYLSTDKETAMAEVRPSIGTYISVGLFKALKDLTVVDCSVRGETTTDLYFVEPDAAEREEAVWADIDRAFSEPIESCDSSADYAPTQVLSELFKRHEFDGLFYKSQLGKGFNIALFDLDAADLINRFLYKVESIAFNFKEVRE